MPRQDFINQLRNASQVLSVPGSPSLVASLSYSRSSSVLEPNPLWVAEWLTERSVEGFDPAEFADLPGSELQELVRDVKTFREIVELSQDSQVSKSQLNKARGYLESVIEIVRKPVLHEWLNACSRMLEEAKSTAKQHHWYFRQDEKEVTESLLGRYRAPRLLLRSLDFEVVFVPVARFGSDGRGVVDLLALPDYETAYYLTWKNDVWWIARDSGPSLRHKRFSQSSLFDAISKLSGSS